MPAYSQTLPAPTTLPQGGEALNNGATIAPPVVTDTSASLTINQTAQKAIINWNSFDVGSNANVVFNQPNAGAMVVNRVVGGQTSNIAGHISANGIFILENPSGAIFYNGAHVSAQSVLVTPSHIDDNTFLNTSMGNGGVSSLVFGAPMASGTKNPTITVNQGAVISAGEAGLVGLVAPQVSNAGTIQANLGTIILAGGVTAYTLDMYGDGLVNLAVTGQIGAGVVGAGEVLVNTQKTGKLLAPGGRIQLSAQAADGVVNKLINADGQISAQAKNGKSGSISIQGIGGDITIAGDLLANGADATPGGAIEVTASKGAVLAQASSTLDTTGGPMGGTISLTSHKAAHLAGKITTQGYITLNADAPITNTGLINANTVEVNSGTTLTLSATGQISDTTAVSADGTLDISGANSAVSLSGLGGSGTVALGGQRLIVDTTKAPDGSVSDGSVFTGNITDGGLSGGVGGGLTIAGGTQLLMGQNTYTGTTVVNEGATLSLLGEGSIASSSALTANGEFDIWRTAGAQIGALSGHGSVVLGGQNLTLTGGTGVFSGSITEGENNSTDSYGAFILNGGNQTLSGINSYGGGTIVKNGTLSLAKAASLGSGTLTLQNGTVRTLSGMALDRAVLLEGNTNSFDTYGQKSSLTNTIAGSGGLTITDSSAAGGGNLTLLGANSYTGSTEVQKNASLTVQVSSLASLTDTILNNGTLIIKSLTDSLFNKDITGNGTLQLQGGGTFTQDAGSHIVQAQVGTGNSVFNGSILLTGENTIGTLNQLQASGDISVKTSGALTLTGLIGTQGTLTLQTGGVLTQTAQSYMSANLLTTGSGFVGGETTLQGTNAFGTIGRFWVQDGTFTLNTTTPLTLGGPLIAHAVNIKTAGNLTLAEGGSLFLTPRNAAETSSLTLSGEGAVLQQAGTFAINSGVDPYASGPVTLKVNMPSTGRITFAGSAQALQAPSTNLVFTVGGNATLSGYIHALSVALYGGAFANLYGTLAGVEGAAAAQQAHVYPANTDRYFFNDCSFGGMCGAAVVPSVPALNDPLSGYTAQTGGGGNAGSSLIELNAARPKDIMAFPPLFTYSAHTGRKYKTDSSVYLPGVAGQDY